MQYILALSIIAKAKEKQIVTTSIDIYTCTVIFLFYKYTMIHMNYSTQLLMETGIFHPAKQTPYVKQLSLM